MLLPTWLSFEERKYLCIRKFDPKREAWLWFFLSEVLGCGEYVVYADVIIVICVAVRVVVVLSSLKNEWSM